MSVGLSLANISYHNAQTDVMEAQQFVAQAQAKLDTAIISLRRAKKQLNTCKRIADETQDAYDCAKKDYIQMRRGYERIGTSWVPASFSAENIAAAKMQMLTTRVVFTYTRQEIRINMLCKRPHVVIHTDNNITIILRGKDLFICGSSLWLCGWENATEVSEDIAPYVYNKTAISQLLIMSNVSMRKSDDMFTRAALYMVRHKLWSQRTDHAPGESA